MNVANIIKCDSKTISYEVFPPKDMGNLDMMQRIYNVCVNTPDYVSVTNRMNTPFDNTVDVCKFITEEFHIPTVAHITTINRRFKDVRNDIEKLAKVGCTNLLVIRGDYPDGYSIKDSDFRYSCDLIEFISHEYPEISIGSSFYPEGYQDESANKQMDVIHSKVWEGAQYLISQMCFDDSMYRLFKLAFKEHYKGTKTCNTPLVRGVLPCYTEKLYKSCSEQVYFPMDFMVELEKANHDYFEAGVNYAVKQLQTEYATSTHAHLYTMNSPKVVSRIVSSLEV